MSVTYQPREGLRLLNNKKRAYQEQRAWIRRAVTIPWPPPSPDLTPCEFYLRPYVKDHVYQPQMPQYLRGLLEHISQAIANVEESQLRRTLEEFE
jgi:hypothetical protein